MFDFGKALGSVGKWEGLRGAIGAFKAGSETASAALRAAGPGLQSRETLRMFSYVPATLAADPRALVVVLHGCTPNRGRLQSRRGVVDARGSLRLRASSCPNSSEANNPNGCFNWFEARGLRARSRRSTLDPGRWSIKCSWPTTASIARRIFITGLSAGGAMTSVMLACLSGSVRGRSDHRGIAVWRRQRTCS